MTGYMMFIVLMALIAINGANIIYSPFRYCFKLLKYCILWLLPPKEKKDTIKRELTPLDDGQRILVVTPPVTKKKEETPRSRWTDSEAEEAWHRRNTEWTAERKAQERLERLRGNRHSYRRKPHTRILLRKHFKELIPDEKGGKK
jgi:hypothetical protein